MSKPKEPRVETNWIVYGHGFPQLKTLAEREWLAREDWQQTTESTHKDWERLYAKGHVRCVKVSIMPETLMQELLTVLQSCERALLTTWGSEDDIDVPVCREITFDVSKVLLKCNKPSVLDPKTLGPVQ